MFSRYSRPPRLPLEDANRFVAQALEIATLYRDRALSEYEQALLKQLRIRLLSGAIRVEGIEKAGRV